MTVQYFANSLHLLLLIYLLRFFNTRDNEFRNFFLSRPFKILIKSLHVLFLRIGDLEFIDVKTWLVLWTACLWLITHWEKVSLSSEPSVHQGFPVLRVNPCWVESPFSKILKGRVRIIAVATSHLQSGGSELSKCYRRIRLVVLL